ncbi:ROK family glucokinase [Lentibacillus sp. Marseille-P4043]|uniref:ROK family glucokinase n=1 Tax=Lentibacillus sp. Marseille-P4043 TaxID=2040293 RepID=UPI000D0B790A|nr:ROK family glucokinase [Lentibacillus sp. Marseille-P4043]
MNDLIIGIDIGGTTSKIGLLDLQGAIVCKWEIPTSTANNGDSIVQDIWQSISDTLSTSQIKAVIGIGIGAPGFIDGATGLVYEAVNIGWKDFQLAAYFSSIVNLPVFVENDANIAVLGENWKGAGNQSENLIALTLGTGVGGGIIANGTILNGVNGTAGEIGHITVNPEGYPCNCGKKGCLETIASATGIVRQAMERIKQEPTSHLASFYQQSGVVTAKDIFDLAHNGDPDCKAIVERTGDVLGFAIANLATVINPSTLLIGGGVSKAGDQLLSSINSAFTKYALPRVSEVCKLKIAQLGNDAGIIGAAFLVKEKLGLS